MDNKSTGIYVDNALDKSLKEQMALALDFSEGNKSLEHLLLYLWHNGINTLFCCGGHDLKIPESDPYILFDGSNFNKAERAVILEKIISSGNCFMVNCKECYYVNKEYVNNMLNDCYERQIFPVKETYEEFFNRISKYQIKDNRIAIYLKVDKTFQPDFGFIKDIISSVKFDKHKETKNQKGIEK